MPVTSIIHTFELHHYDRIYQAYATPADYYLHRYYTKGQNFSGDSIYDRPPTCSSRTPSA